MIKRHREDRHLPNFYAEMKRRGKNLSNLQEFSKSINYLQTHQIETMDDLQERIEELERCCFCQQKRNFRKAETVKGTGESGKDGRGD